MTSKMHADICPLYALLVYILPMLCMPFVCSTCIYDQLQRDEVPRSSLQYESNTDSSDDRHRDKRAVDDLYQPIRIKVEFHDLGEELTLNEQARLKEFVSSTLNKVKGIFNVIPVKDRLRLGRSFGNACNSKIISGINTGKCYALKGSYSGEYCLDWFKIPDDHLEDFYVYNSSSPFPIRNVFGRGAGLLDTDYILYVRALTSQTCITQSQATIAYAAYCQVDQNDRPVAGYINFCPFYLKDKTFNRDKASVTALHEVFHALGFASELFPKFKDCQQSGDGVSCVTRRHTVLDVFGVPRLVTPKVVNLTSEHFQCRSHITENEFGPMLQTEKGQIKSHWDSAFMYGSLMTANIGLPHLTILDNITLAVFEDSGWYKVNYEYADTYLWGKDGGCQFGLSESCQDPKSPYYCMGSSRGCHYLQYDKGICDTDPFLHGCQVYKAKIKDSCLQNDNSPPAEELFYTGEVYTENSRCFMGNLTKRTSSDVSIVTLPVGRCYQTMCNNSELYVRADGGAYQKCPWAQNIQLPGYTGIVECPVAGIMCREDKIKLVTTPQPLPKPTQSLPDKIEVLGRVCIDIHYGGASYNLIYLNSQLFQSCNLDVILRCTGISRRRLENYSIKPAKDNSAVFRFFLLPAKYSDDGLASSKVISILQTAVNTGNFTFILPPSGPRYTATSLIRIKDGGPVVSNKSMSTGVIAGAAAGAIIGAIVIGVLVYFTQRYYIRQSHASNSNRTERRSDQSNDHNEARSHGNISRSHANNSRSHGINPRSPRNNSRSHAMDSRLNGTRPEQRRDSSRSHSRSQNSHQSSQSGAFRSPPSAQSLHIPVDIELTPRASSRHQHIKELLQEAIDSRCDNIDSQGHVNLTFDVTESPKHPRSRSRSPDRSHSLEQSHVINIGVI